MKRLLNTLYVTTDGAWLHKDGANIVMDVDREERARLPAHMLRDIVCIGRITMTPPLLGFCAQQGITVSYLTQQGRFQARVEGPVSGNVLLRREQYRRTDRPESCADIVRHILIGKVMNQRAVLSRSLRDHIDELGPAKAAQIESAALRLHHIAERLLAETDVDVLRGMEGDAARTYFSVFDHLILTKDPAMRFTGRSRRPPLDSINALLSFLYTLLIHDCRSALETVGLDPAVGFLHRDRPGRPGLALDIAEEFRPVMADRLALTLVNRQQIGANDFSRFEHGAFMLNDPARKVVLTAYQERKRDELLHPFLAEKTALGMFPYIQGQLLARHLRGDIEAYPPFIWR